MLSRGEEKPIKSTEGSFHYKKTGTCCIFSLCPCPVPDSWNLDVRVENVKYTPVGFFPECFALIGIKMWEWNPFKNTEYKKCSENICAFVVVFYFKIQSLFFSIRNRFNSITVCWNITCFQPWCVSNGFSRLIFPGVSFLELVSGVCLN